MATEPEHIALANRNHEALLYLMQEPQRFPEWIATIAFYKAVHVVEAVFSQQTNIRTSASHDERLRSLKIPRFKEIFTHFRVLHNASSIARYLRDRESRTDYSSFTDYIAADKVVDKIVNGRLRPIEQHAIKFLSAAGKQMLKRMDSQS